MPVRKTRTRRRSKMSGAGMLSNIWSGLKSLHNQVKEKKLVSNALFKLGHKKAGVIARQFGYGRRQRGGSYPPGIVSRRVAF